MNAMMAITEIYSGASHFGVPLRPYFASYGIMMIMFLGPTLAALGWALTVGQGRRLPLRLVRPLGKWEQTYRALERKENQRTDRAA